MQKLFRRATPSTQQSNSLLTRLKLMKSFIKWLAGLARLKEDEQKDAGSYYPDDQRYG